MSPSGLGRVADGWWNGSVLSQTVRLSPDKLQNNKPDGFVAVDFESFHVVG